MIQNPNRNENIRRKEIIPGWVEHNPTEIWECTQTVIKEALQITDIHHGDIAAVGITNQRETTIVWDKNTGIPLFGDIDTWVME